MHLITSRNYQQVAFGSDFIMLILTYQAVDKVDTHVGILIILAGNLINIALHGGCPIRSEEQPLVGNGRGIVGRSIGRCITSRYSLIISCR